MFLKNLKTKLSNKNNRGCKMKNNKIIKIPNLNSKGKSQSFDKEKMLTQSLFKSIKAMDTSPHDIKNPAFVKLIVEMNEKLEKERDTIKEKYEEILKKNANLKVSEATLKEKNKKSWVKDFFNIIMGISGATYFTVNNEVVPQYISAGVFLVSLLIYYMLRKD